MSSGDIAEGLFEISIGILCIVLSIFGKNSKSEDANFIKKYSKQLLVIFGVLSLFRGTQVFIDDKKSDSKLTTEEEVYSFSSETNYELNDTNNPIYKITISEQQE